MSTLTADQSKVLESIRYFIRKYEKAFPSIPMIAKVAGMCTRKAADHIKELVELGRIKKEQRWEDGRQLSNVYEIVEEQPKKERADYKRSYKSFKKAFNKITDDDYKVTHERQLEFVRLAQERDMALPVLKMIYPHIRESLPGCSFGAMYKAIHQYHQFKDNVSTLGPWFKKVLEDWNERLKTKSAAART